MKTPLTVGLMMALSLPACTLGDSEIDTSRPFRDEWRVQIDAPVRLTGENNFEAMVIGNNAQSGDYVNRGDVIVEFHDLDRVMVEVRRFTRASTIDAAEDDFDMIDVLAQSAWLGFPQDSSEWTPDRSCRGDNGGFTSACGVHIYWNDLDAEALQPEEVGADIRVTLPSAFEGEIKIGTGDANADFDYLNRGNVCVAPNRAHTTIDLARGRAFGSLVAGAEGSTNPPSLTIEGREADLWLDVPADLRASIDIEHQDTPVEAGECEGTTDLEGFAESGTTHDLDQRRTRGVAGPPSEGDTFIVDATLRGKAQGCMEVAFTESPDDFRVGNEEQEVELRGSVHMCNDCIRDIPCAELIPGL
ncbi:MAG: hypothetical protein AAF799_26235 [Myxococcota bacterium]